MSQLTAACLCLALLLLSTTALAQDEAACVAAFDSAQTLRTNLELKRARAQLEICAQEACPGPITKDCRTWLTEVRAEIPSILILAKDGEGADTLDVKVFEGDTLLAEKISVEPLELDPGEHQLRFEHDGRSTEKKIVLRAGEREQPIEVSFEQKMVEPPPPTPPESAGLGPLFYTGVAITGVGLIVGAIAGGFAIRNKNDIDEQCPACTQDDIDQAAIPAHVSTGGFALAGLGAVILVIGIFVNPADTQEATNPLVFRF